MTATEGPGGTKLVLVAMTLANAMILVDQTAVPLALPDIMRTFRVGSQTVQWVLNGRLLPLAGLLVFGGRLADWSGAGAVFLLGAALFAGASAVGGLAPAFGVLLGARILQGVGGALMLPATVAIVSAAFPPERRGRALGTMGGAAAIFAALGPTVGGTLTSVFSWRAVLLINVPRGSRSRYAATSPPAGPALLASSWAGLLGAVAASGSRSRRPGAGPWASPARRRSRLLAAVAFVFQRASAATTSPLVDFRLLRNRNYLGASLSQLLSGMAEIGLGVIFPLLLILNLTMDARAGRPGADSDHAADDRRRAARGPLVRPRGGRPPLVTGFALLSLSASRWRSRSRPTPTSRCCRACCSRRRVVARADRQRPGRRRRRPACASTPSTASCSATWRSPAAPPTPATR